MSKDIVTESFEAGITSTEPFIERKKREYDELVAELEAIHMKHKKL